jgi:hypothetical protein
MLAEELPAARWRWVEDSLAWLRGELFAQEEQRPDTGATHVMVVGDSQVGKTTLLIRLLGVTTPDAAAATHDVLRGGQDYGNAATAAPIRYRWSPDPDRWMLVHDTGQDWLSDDEMKAELGRLRGGGGGVLAWNPDDRPLEVGLPARYGDDNRAELRILDLPGLFAERDDEQLLAHQLVSRFAPVMSLIVFVQLADKMADAFNDPAIAQSAHLAGWTENLRGYRVVLTRAFKDASMQKLAFRTAGRGGSAKAVADAVRTELAEQLADSLTAPVDPDQLGKYLYPVDLGDSWRDLVTLKPQVAETLQPARDTVLDELVTSLADVADRVRHHLAAPDLALRIAARIKYRQRRREETVEEHRQRWAEAAEQLASRQRREAEATQRHREAKATARWHVEAVEALRRWTITYDRPDAPELLALSVRSHQATERDAWLAAARHAWKSWLDAHGGKAELPYVPTRAPIDERGVLESYDAAVGCCGRCADSWWADLKGRSPAVCYGKMTAALNAIGIRLRDRLVDGTEPALAAAKQEAADGKQRRDTLRAECARRAKDVAKLRAAYDQEALADAVERVTEEADLANAGRLKAVLIEKNTDYVRMLAARARSASPADRPFFVLAALQSMRDLDAMMRNA